MNQIKIRENNTHLLKIVTKNKNFLNRKQKPLSNKQKMYELSFV